MMEEKTFACGMEALAATDPEFAERFAFFAGKEVRARRRPCCLIVSAAWRFSRHYCCQGVDEFRAMLPEVLDAALSPIEVKEVVYQACAYLGIGACDRFSM